MEMNFKKALTVFLLVFLIQQVLAVSRIEAASYFKAAKSFLQEDDYENSLRSVERAREIYSELDDGSGVAKCEDFIEENLESGLTEIRMAGLYYQIAGDYYVQGGKDDIPALERALYMATECKSHYQKLNGSEAINGTLKCENLKNQVENQLSQPTTTSTTTTTTLAHRSSTSIRESTTTISDETTSTIETNGFLVEGCTCSGSGKSCFDNCGIPAGYSQGIYDCVAGECYFTPIDREEEGRESTTTITQDHSRGSTTTVTVDHSTTSINPNWECTDNLECRESFDYSQCARRVGDTCIQYLCREGDLYKVWFHFWCENHVCVKKSDSEFQDACKINEICVEGKQYCQPQPTTTTTTSTTSTTSTTPAACTGGRSG